MTLTKAELKTLFYVGRELGGSTMRSNYFWVQDSNGTRKYFSDAKRANKYAQQVADSTKKNVIRYDRDGGQAWFYASETTTDGYRIYSGS